jgi:hypothetical protein
MEIWQLDFSKIFPMHEVSRVVISTFLGFR